MNRVDLHPEHLIDRERVAELSTDEAADLRAHRRECESCRLEASLQLALRDGDDLTPLSAPLMDAVLADFLAGRGTATEASRSLMPAPSRQVGRIRRAAPTLLAFLVGVGAAAAAGVLSERSQVWSRSAAPRASVPRTAPEPVAVSHPLPVAVEAADVVEASSAAPETERAPDTASRPTEPAVRHTSASLFAEATAARRSGDAAKAAALCRQLQRDFASSPEAAASRLSLGRLELHQLGRPAAALQQFEAYLAAGGTLQQEAQLGKAQSLQQLGRASEAKAVFRLIVERYPDSIYADQAKLRLEQRR